MKNLSRFVGFIAIGASSLSFGVSNHEGEILESSAVPLVNIVDEVERPFTKEITVFADSKMISAEAGYSRVNAKAADVCMITYTFRNEKTDKVNVSVSSRVKLNNGQTADQACAEINQLIGRGVRDSRLGPPAKIKLTIESNAKEDLITDVRLLKSSE